jgi:hypothetical protein
MKISILLVFGIQCKEANKIDVEYFFIISFMRTMAN